MPRPWRKTRLDPERTVRLGSGSSVGTKETSAGRLLDTLVQQGEASGRDDDYGAAPEASAPLPDRVRGGNEGTGRLGFVLGLGDGLVHHGDSPDGRHGGHGGVDVRHAQVSASCTEKMEKALVGLGRATVALGF